MGRKIPGRKHRGVRDPEKQRQERLERIKTKINAPPVNKDDQDVPKSLTRLIELKEKAKTQSASKPKRKKKNIITSHPYGPTFKPNVHGIPKKPTPIFTQRPDENDKRFLHRVHKITNSVIREAEFENKYGVHIKRDPETGKVEGVEKRKKDVLLEYMKKAKKEDKDKGKKKKKKKKEEDEGPRLTKWQKRKAKLKAKEEKKLGVNKDEFKMYQDKVGFGETVHAPPTLPLPRRGKESNGAPRPGVKDLLLKSVLNGSKTVKSNEIDISNKSNTKLDLRKTANKAIDRKGKRKDLPNALRRQLDKQQGEVIEAYKNLKKQKYVNK